MNKSSWRRFLTGTVVHRGPILEQAYPEGLQPIERAHARAGEMHEEEGVVERNGYEITVIRNSHSSVPLGRLG